jgi:Holliday junction resolvasome RuvABC endonuclease subunit
LRALGLDPSLTAFGWAIHDPNAVDRRRRVASGHDGTGPKTVPVVRFMHFRETVSKLLDEHDPDVVGIESPAYQAGPFQRIHFGLMIYALEAIFERRKDCVLFDPATLKLLAKEDSSKRKGSMGKLDMQRMVQLDTMEASVIDNNEADAYLVGKFAARFAVIQSGGLDPERLTPSEKSVFLTRSKRVKTMRGTVVKRVAHAFRENSRFFAFSKIPGGSVMLPERSAVNPRLSDFLAGLEEEDS